MSRVCAGTSRRQATRFVDMSARPSTLGELRSSGWVSRPVSDEIRANAVERIRRGVPLFEGVLGYEDTVMPQLENAVLAGHDVIFLGERLGAVQAIGAGLIVSAVLAIAWVRGDRKAAERVSVLPAPLAVSPIISRQSDRLSTCSTIRFTR